MTLTAEQLHILQHSLGLDAHGRGRSYRNRYATHRDDGSAFNDCEALAAAGLMRNHGPISAWGSMLLFSVTDAGKDAIREQSPPSPKLTAGQQRYREWQALDCSIPFGEWVKSYRQWKADARRYAF